jgi:hypothetical protein
MSGSFGLRVRYFPQAIFKKSHEFLAELASGKVMQIRLAE